ncbi:MAG TPA: ABC transporter substrate-binding protein [Trebonia sp.]|jgi:peptide/nickel transport system substrate-binding protein
MSHVARLRAFRHRFRTLLPVAVLVAVVSLIVGCATSEPAPTSAFSLPGVSATESTTELHTFGLAATSATPEHGGTLTVGWEEEPPCLVNDWVQVGYLSRQYLDNLVGASSNGGVVPWLATSWKVTNDRTTYTFALKPHVEFTDGTPLTAQSIADNFDNWFGNPSSPNYNGYLALMFASDLRSWKATGPLTFQVNLKAPDQYFLSALSTYPGGIQSPQAVARGPAENCQDPIGTGPFEVVKWNRGVDVILKRNPDYDSAPANAANQGPAYLSEVVWKFISDDETRWASLQTDESQVIYDVPATDWSEAEKEYQIEQYITAGTPNRLLLATQWGPFKDVRVRKAFEYAFNGPSAVQAVYQGELQFNGNGTESPSTPGYDDVLANPFPYNPAEASKLLDEVGWTGRNAAGYRTKDGKALVLRLVYSEDINATEEDVDLFQLMQQEEKAVGIDLELVPLSSDTYWQSGSNQPAGTWDLEQWYDVDRTSDTLVVDAAEGSAEGVIPSSSATIEALAEELTLATATAKTDAIAARIQTIIVKQDAAVLGEEPLPVTLAISPKVHGLWLEPDVGEPVLSDAYYAK